MTIATILPRQLHQASLAGQPVELIDVRTPAEFHECHVTFAQNVPLDQLHPAQWAERRHNASQPLYVICRSGSRARQACEKLGAAGLTNVVNVEGGTQAWEQQGLPVVRGAKAISLERQVRVVAGGLVLIGTAIAAFASPYGLLLTALVGAGLVFAGVTDRCGMALLLARLPWNQAPRTASQQTPACSAPPTTQEVHP